MKTLNTDALLIKFYNLLILKTGSNAGKVIRILLFIITLVVFTSSKIHAQNSFRDGYIITTTNDTVYGQLDYRANNLNYHSCYFKKGNKIEKLIPNQIKGYGFVNDKYYSSGIIKDAFVEVLVSGAISLYKYKGTFYVSKDQKKIFKLENKEVKTLIKGKEEMKEEMKNVSHWKGVLSYLISDCLSNPMEHVQNINLDEKELDNLVIKYNKCRHKNFDIYKKNIPWTRIQYGGILGISWTSVNTTTIANNYYYVSKHYSSTDPNVGVVFLLTFPKVFERLAIQTELHFSNTNYSALKVEKSVGAAAYYHTYVRFSTLSVPVGLNYNIPWKKNAFYVQAGVIFKHHFQTLSKMQSKFVYNGVVTNYPDSQAFDVSKNILAMYGGIGFSKSFKKFTIRTRVQYSPLSLLSMHWGFKARSQQFEFSVAILKK